MKVIVTGASGSAGQHVIKNCLANQRISKVCVLTRTALPGDIESHPKVDLVMHQDFTNYSEYLIRRLEGATACIWAIGGRAEQRKGDKTSYRHICVDLPIATAKIFCEKLASKTADGSRFRFVICSTKHIEKSKKALLFTSDGKKWVSDLEKGIMEVAASNKKLFEVFILRPAAFASEQPVSPTTPTQKRYSNSLGHGTGATIEPAKVGKAMVMIASDGWSDHVIENETITKVGS